MFSLSGCRVTRVMCVFLDRRAVPFQFKTTTKRNENQMFNRFQSSFKSIYVRISLWMLCCILGQSWRAHGQLALTYEFTTASNWTWVGGSKLTAQYGLYGTKGIAASKNVPGGRYSHAMVIDPASGDIYVFGGSGYSTASSSKQISLCCIP